jgi:glycosyltransferase involved in cell wall biosynthesis
MRICFSCPMAQPVFEPHVKTPFGGSEVRAFYFSTGLVALGHDVHLLVQTHGETRPRTMNGVQLNYERLPKPLMRRHDFGSTWEYACRWPEVTARRSVRSLRKWFSRRPEPGPRFLSQLAAIPADLYACFGVHRHAADVIFTAGSLGKPAVLLLASDTDLDPAYALPASAPNHYGQPASLCSYALRQATGIVAQTAAQQALLAERFGREATVIRNPFAVPMAADGDLGRRSQVLWIGRADTFSKRADLAIELARQCPQLPFHLVMNRRNPRVYESLLQGLPNNVTLSDYVPYREIDQRFRTARCLLNTSDAEGFPNTFLQAAGFGVPIVSLRVDPDQMLSRHGCGCVMGGDLSRTAEQLRAWSQDTLEYRHAAAAGAQFVARFHDRDDRSRELEQMMQGMIAAQRRSVDHSAPRRSAQTAQGSSSAA